VGRPSTAAVAADSRSRRLRLEQLDGNRNVRAARRRSYIRGMKVIAFDRFKPGVTMETIEPYLREEVANVWRLWKAGIVRENYARADEPGVIIVFEVESVEEARRYVADFALSRAGLLEWQYLPVQAPLPLEALMDPSVDVGEPFDRTARSQQLPAARR
jgi:hypothetical protein